jgi:hypothetical protein
MGRTALYAVIVVLTVFVLSAAFILKSGGGSSQAALSVSVHDLSTAPDAHSGERVTTTGVLRLALEPREQYLVTADGLGVLILGYDEDALRELDGRTVTVIGRFGHNERDGVYIEADSVTEIR